MAREILIAICSIIGVLVICIGMFQYSMDIMQAIFAYFVFRREKKRSDITFDFVTSDYTVLPAISIFVPAYNEEVTIASNIYNLTSLNYPNHQIIVINDGSKDNTMKVLKKKFNLKKAPYAFKPMVNSQKIKAVYRSPDYRNVIVVDKVNGGKADALNAALNICRTPLFCVIDADSVLKEDALTRAIRPFIEMPDRILAVGGVINGMNTLNFKSGRVIYNTIGKSILQNIQALEYFRAFLLGRMFWNMIDSTFIVSGAFGIFSKDAVIDVGGYSQGIVGEDIELIFKLKERSMEKGENKTVQFIPDPICWTEVPNSLTILSKQRMRWQQGMLETLFMHRHMTLNKKYRLFGFLSMPYLLITEVIFLPISFLGYLTIPVLFALGYFNTAFFIAFLAVEFGLGVFVSNLSLQVKELQDPGKLDRLDILIFSAISVLENFGYRQLCTTWRFMGLIKYISGSKSWGEMKRTGF